MSGPPVSIEATGLSDPGQLRENNEDQFLVAQIHRTMIVGGSSLGHKSRERIDGNYQGTILLVADGMGGEEAGDRASRMAVETFVDYIVNEMPWYYKQDERYGGDLVTALREGVERCEAAIHRYQRESSTEGRMGTTFTMAYILWPNMYVVHAGDSRCYLLRQGELRQLTKDHTVAQLMFDQGRTKELDEENYGHVLWNAVGADFEKSVRPQVGKYELSFGDYLMLCSDGLYGMVSNDRIHQLLLAPSSSREACQQLIDEANQNGGTDNVTVVVARIRAGAFEDDQLTMEQTIEIEDDEPTVMTKAPRESFEP